jgi:hypothetical protein
VRRRIAFAEHQFLGFDAANTGPRKTVVEAAGNRGQIFETGYAMAGLARGEFGQHVCPTPESEPQVCPADSAELTSLMYSRFDVSVFNCIRLLKNQAWPTPLPPGRHNLQAPR